MHYHNPHGSAILYPNEWARYDPTQNSYSPLAQYSAHTLKEHNETLDRLALQLEVIARKLAENDVQGTEDHRRYTKMLDALQREESDIVVLLSHNRLRIEELQQSTSTEVVRRREEVELNHQTNRDLTDELGNLSHVEADLFIMKKSIEDKLAATSERKSLFSREFRHGMSILETDHQEAKTASAFTTAMLTGNTAAAAARSRMSLVESPTRYRSPLVPAEHIPRSPHVPHVVRSPYISPTRVRPPSTTSIVPVAPSGFRGTLRGSPKRNASVVFSQSQPAPLSPRRTAESVIPPPPPPPFANMSADVPRAEDQFKLLSEPAERLHYACRVGDTESIRKLLREFQGAATETHPITGDTALHVLCSAPVFSEQAVKDVVLPYHEALYVYNKAGYFPFHLACLNVADVTDALKMYFVNSCNVDPSLRTKMGETVAHLCARSDRTHSALRCVVERMKVDVTYRVQLANREGYFKQMNALDVAADMQHEAARNREYLAHWFAEHNL
ncbi:Hypothetical protein, putative [Bodo saltans]|uniref:Uncharacterized protein n=1 Tax=Bodo saltans TaxID=75058 RepID=A0A0S4JLH3_BODSA|nr:Hypothetical protein, putative [Bodo saltans]|eukprot:CUG91226.1 Hypothetical protein, putative [Bodo saltans]